MFLKKKDSMTWEKMEFALAAKVLNVSEFSLFELAYRQWFGVNAKEVLLDKVFIDYIAYETVPFWARHYARQTIKLCDDAGCYVPKLVTSEVQCQNPLLSTDLWILMTGMFLITLLMA